MTIEEKYNIHYMNGKRYYKFDMNCEIPILEHTTPYKFQYKDIEIYDSAWNRMTLSVLETLDELNPKTAEELLQIKYKWTKQPVFSIEKRANYFAFKGVFLNANHTATHAMMNIQGLVQAYGVNVNDCSFYIRRHQSAEPVDAREYFRTLTINRFENALKLRGFSHERIVVVVNNVEKINKLLAKISPGYDDFFLFNDYYYFNSYKIKTIEYLEKTHFNQNEKINLVKKTLGYLDEFYKFEDFYVTISNNDIKTDFLSTLENEILFLFSNLKSNVILSSKLFSRMSLLHRNEMDLLAKLNTNENLFKLASIHLKSSFYFNYPFISTQKTLNLTNDNMILSYIYNHDEIEVTQISRHIEKMHLKNVSSIISLFDDVAEDFVQVEKDKLVKKAYLDLSAEFIEGLSSDLTFYIKSFGNIDSRSFVSYSTFPKLNIHWTKELLLGIVRSYLNDTFCINYLNKKYKNIDYQICFR